jgi:hypothetical protein
MAVQWVGERKVTCAPVRDEFLIASALTGA